MIVAKANVKGDLGGGGEFICLSITTAKTSPRCSFVIVFVRMVMLVGGKFPEK